MAVITINPADVHIVRLDNAQMLPDGPAGVALSLGQAVRIGTANGYYGLASAGTAGSADVRGVVCGVIAGSGTAAANETVTVMHRGILSLGTALDGINYGGTVFLSNTAGALDTAAGAVSTVVGYVQPAHGVTTAERVLYVNL
jgi:hypothetical protein